MRRRGVDGRRVVTAKTKGTKLPKAAQTALRALSTAIDELGEVPPASNHIPAKVRTVSVDQWRGYACRMGISDADTEDAKRMAFKRAHAAFVAARHVGVRDAHRWPAN